MNPIYRAYANAATFSGRMSRRDYFCFAIIHVLASLVVCMALFYLVLNVIPNRVTMFFVFPLSFGVPCAIVLPFLSATVRRLHDTNCSGWVAAVALFPLCLIFLAPIVLFSPGSSGYNKYGHSPKAMRQGEVSLEEFGKD